VDGPEGEAPSERCHGYVKRDARRKPKGKEHRHRNGITEGKERTETIRGFLHCERERRTVAIRSRNHGRTRGPLPLPTKRGGLVGTS